MHVFHRNHHERRGIKTLQLALLVTAAAAFAPQSSRDVRTKGPASLKPPIIFQDAIPLSSTTSSRGRGIGSDDVALRSAVNDEQQQKSFVLSMEEIKPILKFKKGEKDKVLNAFGAWCGFVIALTMPIWMLSMDAVHFLGNQIEDFDPNRALFDKTGKIWCRTYLTLTDSYPEIKGDVERLKAEETKGQACLFVANHASFLDIAVLCTVLDPVFKFIAKDSLKKFPGVGRQLDGGEHILIDRDDKRSQLRTFKQVISYLRKGIPIMAFPEGARSMDGRLMDFKGGLFSMAVKAKVPIVPLSISNTHAVMPTEGFLPVQKGEGKLSVYVHPPIDMEGKSEAEMVQLVREALLSKLPLDQHPLPVNGDESVADGVALEKVNA